MASADSDLKSHALSSTTDFYELLSLPPTASESDIRRAYRKTALKYHPDKVSASDTSAHEKFHALQIAYDVLSDPTIKELYDNARRAREAKKAREELVSGRRRELVKELEKREGDALGKRKREDDLEAEFERELRRLAEDGRRRRKKREEELRQEMQAGEIEPQNPLSHKGGPDITDVTELDRSITLRFQQNENTSHLDSSALSGLFSRFGSVEDVVMKERRMRPPGEKHKTRYTTAIVIYSSIVGAHAAVTDFPSLASTADFNLLEEVGWATGKAPDFVPQPTRPSSTLKDKEGSEVDPGIHMANGKDTANGKNVPNFSFKPSNATNGSSGPSLDEVTMMRLKNAERRRLEKKMRDEEAAAATVENEELR